MTFLEAAIEILRDADGAMHYAEVAKLAVDRNLLSHVGRDPEAAMRSCLTSAVRTGRGGEEPLILREKPAHYGIRPGAELPAPKAPPAAKEPNDVSETAAKSNADSSDADSGRGKTRGRRRPRAARGEAPAPASVEVIPVRTKRGVNGEAKRAPRVGAKAKPASKTGQGRRTETDEAASNNDASNVEFEAPSGSGLDGVTDVAVVMANAMSRLVEERPELRDELDAMQQTPEPEPEPAAAPAPMGPGAGLARSARPHGDSRSHGDSREEDRSSRRRRRRRRRGKRVEWSAEASAGNGALTVGEKLLDGVASVLGESGSRSLHVRQIAEMLAQKGLLGGEISEIERAVTAEILIDLHRRGRASRFVARGDARYQLQGTRLPEKVAKAEQAFREAARALEAETQTQLLQWLQSLGARSLESLVRMWLSAEGYALHAALPPNRGLGRLVAQDPDPEEEDGRTLVLVVPRRTVLDAKLWEGDLERNNCTQVLVFSMGDVPEDFALAESGRLIRASELAGWLNAHKVGVTDFSLAVQVLDPTLIESIAGLDT
ncbi:MAG: winged helix-turn-helix domain-containing protein [Nannocystaceae bacterium]|nr:winged helix-turn-helix domain-containing protein [Nannocystaceae bacterium]